jgi:D-3-phosphoglycerate dehydrogenase / 2-oxoglutarate reductase
MKIAILDDYQDVVKDLECFPLMDGYDVTVFTTPPKSQDELVERLFDKDCIVLLRERTEISRNLLSRLPNLKLISQTGKISNHIRAYPVRFAISFFIRRPPGIFCC